MTPMWGPAPLAPDHTRFRLWAPGCETLTLEIDGGEALAMARDGDGWFEAEAPVGAGARYRFRVSDDLAIPDPASRAQVGDVHGWSVVVDPDAYRWQTEGWRGRPWVETILYECHPGTMGGFAGVSDSLPALVELGITAIELMPVNAFSGKRNWGYDGVLPYAPAAAYGTPDELKALIDRAHGLGVSVFLDVVYNHFGPDGNYLPVIAPDFFDEARHTPWGDAIAFGRDAVAHYFIDNARMWIEDYRFDGLRFDAVHAIEDNAFLDRLAEEIRAGAGDRHVHLVLENESNDAERLGDAQFDAQWNDDFHNVLHVLLTDESGAYYQDFADRPEQRLARCLSEGFIYQGEGSPNHDGKPRGKPSAHLPPTRFVAFLQNHDQVGNRALGERLPLLTDTAKLAAATALLLLCPQIPLLFMGEETGSRSPFLFFTDFHDELADAVREGRRKEFAKFPAFADPEQREKIPDPNAHGTFEASRAQPGDDAADRRDFYRMLIAIRRDRIVPVLAGATAIGAHVLGEKAVIARWRLGDGATLTLALNLGEAAVPVDLPDAPPLATVGAGIAGDALAPASLVAWLGCAA
jgi:maltooligosyltrehalose trehalohydrolase